MYERYNDIERITKAMSSLMELNEPCYDDHCKNIRDQLHHAIAYEAGHHQSMSQYSSIYH